MAADFPTSLHDFSATYTDATAQQTTHPGIHNDLNAELAAVQTKVGVDSSAVATSLDYLVKNASNPGHTHTLANGASDVTATASEINTACDGVLSTATEINYLSGITAQTEILNPVGAIQMYGGATAPTGWLLCDGSAVSRTTYSDLYQAIATTYGVGDGSTTFNVPDMRDSFPVGAGTTYSRGDTGGSATADLSHTHTTGDHTLTSSEMPSHTHTQNSHTHNVVNQNQTQYNAEQATGPYYGLITSAGSSATSGTTATNQTTGGGNSHNHGSTGSGGSSTQSILNPYVGVYYIIKT